MSKSIIIAAALAMPWLLGCANIDDIRKYNRFDAISPFIKSDLNSAEYDKLCNKLALCKPGADGTLSSSIADILEADDFSSFRADPAAPDLDDNEKKYLDESVKKADEASKSSKTFAGINFGTGLSLVQQRKAEIEKAVVGSNGLVRVDHEKTVQTQIMLESHYFFFPNFDLPGLAKTGSWGIGPFVAIQSSDEKTIDGMGFGMMMGLKCSEDSDDSFNFGIGGYIDPEFKSLATGYREGMVPPGSATEVQIKESAQWSLLITVSFQW